MLNFFAKIWNGFIQFLAILLPFGKDSRWRRMGRGVRLTLQIIVLALIVVGLYLLDRNFLGRRVVPNLPEGFWSPLLFLLVYFLIWTAWWIWKLLMEEPEPSTFPDIDTAWKEATRALAQAGIRLTDWPVFLVLGRPEAPEEHLFSAAQLQLVVKQTPPGPHVPLHVYASRDAIFITCPGASLLGKHAAYLALEDIDELGAGGEGEGEVPGGDQTIRPSRKEKKVIERLVKIGGRQMNVLERRAARRELEKPMPDLLKNAAEVETLQARLSHLGRLIVRDRQPFCAINGVLVLAPIGGTDTSYDAQQTAEICARDLATVRQMLKMQCPIFVLACDLEALPGFSEFIQRVPAKERAGRLGQRFPLAPLDTGGDKVMEQVDESIHHLCNNYIRDWVYRSFQADGLEDNKATAINTGLYLFLDEMRARKKNLGRILTHGIAKEGPAPLLYGGCYLAATGADKDRSQAFVAGVFKRLLENQSYVTWTDEALNEDRRYHRRANVGYVLLGGLALAIV